MPQLESLKGFVNIGKPRHIWAIPAIHSAVDELTELHNKILNDIQPGDRIVYLGNYTGYGNDAPRTVDELLAFRRLVLSIPSMIPSDITYMKGMQEEMLSKLLQLQFASQPSDVLLWMLGNGLQPTLHDYGVCVHEGIEACRQGIMSITRWTQNVRSKIRAHAGHEDFMMAQQRAVYTCTESYPSPLLFVHAGINIGKPLGEQGDSLWWESQNFETINAPYKPFEKVVRGYDPAHRGMNLNCVTATIDDGCGFGGKLVCAGFGEDGQVHQIL
ncbi:MAG: hypothetical protein AB8B83_09780 [Bdellovibrionales bacterium]